MWNKTQSVAQNFYSISITIYSHSCFSFYITPPELTIFLQPVDAGLFRLFSKPISGSNLNFLITREINSFEMFLESSEQPEVGRCQIRAVWRMWGVFKSNAVYRIKCGSTGAGSGIIMLQKLRLFSPTQATHSLF